MISIIVCSVNPALRALLSENIRLTIGITDFEIIIIENEVEKVFYYKSLQYRGN